MSPETKPGRSNMAGFLLLMAAIFFGGKGQNRTPNPQRTPIYESVPPRWIYHATTIIGIPFLTAGIVMPCRVLWVEINRTFYEPRLNYDWRIIVALLAAGITLIAWSRTRFTYWYRQVPVGIVVDHGAGSYYVHPAMWHSYHILYVRGYTRANEERIYGWNVGPHTWRRFQVGDPVNFK